MKQMKPWTIMIYLAGDNNLSDEMIWALKEIYRVGSGGYCNIVVQFDPSASANGPRRYDITKLEGKGPSTCDQDGILEIESIRETLVLPHGTHKAIKVEDCADKRVLAHFVRWAIRKKRAHHYMLILSGHGSGVPGGILEDMNPSGRLTIPSLGRALSNALTPPKRRGKGKQKTRDRRPWPDKIDVLGLDSCTMSTIEVACEVLDSVRFLVASEGFVRNAGWPYHRLLELLREGPDEKTLATRVVERFTTYYSDYISAGVSTDQAVTDLSAIDETFINKMSDLSGVLKEELISGNTIVTRALVLAHWDAQSFNNEQHVDLFDFCKRLLFYVPLKTKSVPCQKIRSICESIVGEDWTKLVPLSMYSGSAYQHAHGLSIYFPWAEFATDYSGLSFHERTKWGAFLRAYVDKTVREVREADEHHVTKIVPGCQAIGAGAYSVHRAGGRDGVRGGGPNGARGGGPNGARFETLGAEELIRLSSMKNFPTRFHPFEHPDLRRVRRDSEVQIRERLKQLILSSRDSTLEQVLQDGEVQSKKGNLIRHCSN